MNPFDLFKNIGQLQQSLQSAQGKLSQVRVTGSAGGDMVTVEIDGTLRVRAFRVSEDAFRDGDATLVSDLCKAAMNDALVKVRAEIQSSLGSLAGEFPAGFSGQSE